MTLKFARTLQDLRPVLKDSFATGPDIVYQVFTNLDNKWVNMTQIDPGIYQGEFAKTFGHFHLDGKDETYHVDSGKGLAILQKENEVLLIKAGPGDEIIIPHNYGHAWVNIDASPLILYDNHNDPKSDYEQIKNNHGMAYYITDGNGHVNAVPNPNYKNLPEPKWLTAAEFNAQKL